MNINDEMHNNINKVEKKFKRLGYIYMCLILLSIFLKPDQIDLHFLLVSKVCV